MSETQEACGRHVFSIKTTGTLTRERWLYRACMPLELSIEVKE